MAANPSPPKDRDQRLNKRSEDRSKRGHHFRYHLAAGFCPPGSIVMDAACGSGYGAAILGDVEYIGVDIDPPSEPVHYLQADLTAEWEHDFPFDVFVGFETIEHLVDFKPYVKLAKRARRHIILSAPIVPTTHLNPWHLHNFAPGEVAALIVDEEWDLFQSALQPAELSEVYVFARR